MKIATFNINSVRARIGNLCEWLKQQQPDIVLLQELKCQDEQFPLMEIEELGYKCAIHGQKAYNGVAILSKYDMDDIVCGIDGDTTDGQSRYIEATIQGMRICCLYLPNGNPIGTEKFEFKLNWMDRLGKHIKNNLLQMEKPVIIGGDWNVIPTDNDCVEPSDWLNDAATQPQTRARFNAFQNLGMTEVFSALNDEKQAFTFWDYQKGAWQKDNGIRIDFFLTNGLATDMVGKCWVDKEPRAKEKASDHTPLILELENE